MRVSSTIQTIDEAIPNGSLELFDVEISGEYDLNTELVERVLSAACENGTASAGKVFYTNGLVLVDQHIHGNTPLLHTFAFDQDVVVMEFYLDGQRSVWNDVGNKQSVPDLMPEKSHNLRYVRKGNYYSMLKKGSESDVFILILSSAFYFKLINQHSEMHREFARDVSAEREAYLSPHYLSMSQDMRTLIANVRNCTRKGSFHRLCLEIKISELLMLQYEQYHLLTRQGEVRDVYSRSDQEKLESAKDVLDREFAMPPTIKQLAIKVGLNEFKLKSGFKRMFHTTIHAYVVKLRMQRAYQMMQTDQNVLIREVALEVGYQNPSHFSAAFKEFYGYGPKEFAS